MIDTARASNWTLLQASSLPGRQGDPRRSGLLLAALFCLQGVTLLSYYRFSVEPFPPEAYDQAVNLTRVYELTEAYDTYGLGRLLHVPFEGGAQGVLLTFEGALLEVATRWGRLGPLLLNFIALVTVELALFSTALRLTGRLGLALSALGLFLSAHSMWFWAGGLFDFRIDWLASCLFGTWACLVLRSGVFDDRRWSIAAALVGALLILTRFITATYLFGIQGVLIAVFLAASPWLPTGRRALNGIIGLAVMGIAVLPFILDSLTQIYGYYVVGHLTGPEKGIRAAEAGVSSLRDHMLYYPTSILRDHLGAGFLFVVVLFALTTLMAAAPRRWDAGSRISLLAEILLLIGTITGPIAILTTDQSKSPVVGGIVVVPLVLALVRLPRWLGILPGEGEGRRSRIATLAGGALCAVAGLAVSLDASATSRPMAARHGFYAWGRLITDVAQDALDRGQRTPHIFLNTLSSHFFSPAFTAYAYERTGSFIRFDGVLGDAIFARDPAWIMERLAAADIVVLATGEKPGIYPILDVLKALDPQIRDWAEHHLRLTRSYSFDGLNVDVYRRP